jgi:general secretion pathway protein K
MTGDPKSPSRERERGLALLVVLWGVTAAALLVSAFNVVARSGATFISSEVEFTEAEALADAGLEIAAAHLIGDDKAGRWRPNGKPHRLVLGAAELTIVLDDPNGLIDVNTASRAVLLGLLSRAMGGPDEAEPLLERLMKLRGKEPAEAGRNAPETPQRAEPNGDAPGMQPAEDAPPTTPPMALAAPKPRIHDVTDLRRIEGMPAALYRKIAPLLTVYGRDSRINPFHAPRAVLLAIPGLSETDVDRFLNSKPRDITDAERLPSSLGKAGAFLANHTGPAIIVSVAVGKPGRGFLLARQFVIATGIDENAPYRLLSVRPLSADSFTSQDRAPQS